MNKISEMNYEELKEYIQDVFVVLQNKAFESGYERGYADHQNKIRVQEGGNPLTKTDQERRDEIIRQAKAFGDGATHFAELKNVGSLMTRFDVNKEKRTVVALLYYRYVPGEPPRFKGIAKCAPSDCFNEHIGKAIALRRALGLAVPDEYLNAPQPTEVRVGDIVQGEVTGKKAFVTSVEDGMAYGRYEDGTKLYSTNVKIIDDSRDDKGVDE